MRLVHSDTSALSQTLSVRALTCTRVLVSRTPLGFTFSYSHKYAISLQSFSREKQDPPTRIPISFSIFVAWDCFFLFITGFTGTRKKALDNIPVDGTVKNNRLPTGIIFTHLYTFTCLLRWQWTQQIGSSSSCRIINMHAVNMTVSQSVQYSRNFCPPVVR